MTKEKPLYKKAGWVSKTHLVTNPNPKLHNEVLLVEVVQKHLEKLQRELKEELLTKGKSVSRKKIKEVIDISFDKIIGVKK